MDATRIHLFITHLPVFGLFIGSLALAWALVIRNTQVKIVSLSIILVSIIGGLIAFQTGNLAEDVVEKISGISDEAIEEHEEAAEFAVIFFYGLALLSVAGLYFQWKENRYARPLIFVILAISIFTFFIVARVASLGGKIMHTEIMDVPR
jgi:uncharacterized membrane protein